MKYIYILLNLFLLNTSAFISSNSVFKSNYKNTNIKVYKSKNSKSNKNIVFYTGGNSIIPSDIYNNFLKTIASSNYNVYSVTNDKYVNEELFSELEYSNDETIFVGHSTGCVNAIDESNNNKFVKKLVLLDPVNNKDFFKFNPVPNFNLLSKEKPKKNLELKHVKNVLLLNAEKSYDWSFFPKFNMPFIPAFALTEDEVKNLNNDLDVKTVKAKDYGHSDILDSMYSDFMHNTISKGNSNRDEEQMYEYYLWIAQEITEFASNQLLLSNDTSNDTTNIN